MSKFCTNCGKELINGKCDCVKKTDVNVTSNDLVNKFINIVKCLIEKPITTLKENTKEENFNLGLIAMLLSAVVSGIFTYFLIDNMTSFSLLGYRLVKFSFIKIFISSTIAVAIWYGILGFVIYLFANKLFKLNITIKEIYTFIGILSIVLTLTLIVGAIVLFVSYKLMCLLFIIGSLFYTVYFVVGLMEVTEIEKDKIAFLYVPAISIAFFLVYYVLPNVLA